MHALWRILIEQQRGYASHPETRRWRGKEAALYARHDALVEEMTRRGYRHASSLDPRLAAGAAAQTEFVDPPARQRELLRAKGCDCVLDDRAG